MKTFWLTSECDLFAQGEDGEFYDLSFDKVEKASPFFKSAADIENNFEIVHKSHNRKEIKQKAIELAFKKLGSFVSPDGPQPFDESNDYYQPEDKTAPFFSEGFLYALFGKEYARSVMCDIHRLERFIKFPA